MNEIKETFIIDKDCKAVTITHKNGVDDKPPVSININGNITAVGEYIQKRMCGSADPGHMYQGQFDPLESNILVDRDELTISLTINENDPHEKGCITGIIKENPDLTEWHINTGSSWTHSDLAQFIKMHRSCFKSNKVAMEVSNSLRDLKMTIDKKIEVSDDTKGTFKNLLIQKVIETSIRSSFNLEMPIHKGMQAYEFEVELYVNPDTFKVTMISPDINDVIAKVQDEVIDEQIKAINEAAPKIVIIEQ